MENTKKKRLAVVRFWYEGNAFCPTPCTQGDFERREWLSGAAALLASRGTATELGAVASFARAHNDWEVVALRCASALPAGPIDDDVYRALKRDVLAGLAEGMQHSGWDAVYLSLHGAAITNARRDPDLDLVRAVRHQVGPSTAIGASFDMHANLSPSLGPLLDMASGYHTYPHVDMDATAARVLDGLLRIVEAGLRTRVVIRKPGLLLSSFNMRTSSGPMSELQELAAAHRTDAIVDASVFGGFPYADTEEAGASVLVVTDVARDEDGRRAGKVSHLLTKAVKRLAPQFSVKLPTPREGLAEAVAIATREPGLVAVTDPADNPLSGGTCDTPALFRALVDLRTELPCVFASFADEEAVAMACNIGEGGLATFSLGARRSTGFGAPVEVKLRVEKLTAGDFINTGPMETGVRTRCGRTAMLSLADQPNVRVVLTEVVAPANDPAFFALHGIDLSGVRILCVKAKNHFRAAFTPMTVAIIDVDAPGPAALDIGLLPFRHAGRL